MTVRAGCLLGAAARSASRGFMPRPSSPTAPACRAVRRVKTGCWNSGAAGCRCLMMPPLSGSENELLSFALPYQKPVPFANQNARDRTHIAANASTDQPTRSETWRSSSAGCVRADDPVQPSAGTPQGVNTFAYRRVLDQRRGMMRLDPCVDHQCSLATPVLLSDEGADPADVRRRVGARERHPHEVVQRTRR